MPSQTSLDKRRHPRKARSIRFRFDHGGDRHFAVTTIVSLGGAFLKASHIPRPGSVLTLVERFNPDGAEVLVRCEVVWTSDQPSLERPDTGFGVRFIEAVTRGDPGQLEDFLHSLEPAFKVTDIAFEERPQGVHAVFRFPELELDPAGFDQDEAGFAVSDEPPEIDLARELARLAREHDTELPEAAASGLRSTLTATSRPSSPPSPATQTPEPRPPPAPAPAPPEPAMVVDDKRDRSRRRTVTGIFTALFGRGSKAPEPPAFTGPEPTPAVPAPTLHAPAVRRAELNLRWGDTTMVADIESMGRQGATLWMQQPAPQGGTTIALQPRGAPAHLSDLVIDAQVTLREDRLKKGATWLAVTFHRIDERGRPGRFREFLRHVNGLANDGG